MEQNKEQETGTKKRYTKGYIGTYYSEKSKGIYQFSFDEESGDMTEPELFFEAPNAKWISLSKTSMAIPVEREGRAGTCFLELKDGKIVHTEEILEEKQTPCYLLRGGDDIYTANYHEGTVKIYRMEGGKPSVVKTLENGKGAGCHQILLHESYLMVPCLAQDRIRLFDRERDFDPVGEIVFQRGSGPRHGIFNREHSKFYVVSEWSNELFVFGVQDRKFELEQTLSVILHGNAGGKAAAAAIRLSEEERFLYISVRGENILTVLDVSGEKAVVIQQISCGGIHPRDFILSKNEKFLLVSNRFSGEILSMERDRKSGKLEGIRHRAKMPEAVALVLTQ